MVTPSFVALWLTTEAQAMHDLSRGRSGNPATGLGGRSRPSGGLDARSRPDREFAWLGWFHPRNYRRAWAEGTLLSEDGGLLIVVADAAAIGFVNWRKVPAGVGRSTGRSALLWLRRPAGRGTAAPCSGFSSRSSSRTRLLIASRRGRKSTTSPSSEPGRRPASCAIASRELLAGGLARGGTESATRF